MTCVDVVPLSAVVTIFDWQFENIGAETSINENNISKMTKMEYSHKLALYDKKTNEAQ